MGEIWGRNGRETAVAEWRWGQLLFAAGTERDIKAYNLTALQGGGVVNAPIALFSGHCAKIFTIDVSADGRWLASAAQDFDMETWSIDAEKLLGRNVDADGPTVESPAQHLEASEAGPRQAQIARTVKSAVTLVTQTLRE